MKPYWESSSDPLRKLLPTDNEYYAEYARRVWDDLEGKSEEVKSRYCEHGSYVGANRALAYRCPFCPESSS
jgi:hypothetical protein